MSCKFDKKCYIFSIFDEFKTNDGKEISCLRNQGNTFIFISGDRKTIDK